MSTETIRTIRDGEPSTATSTFAQLLSSDQRLNSQSFVHCCFTSTETIELKGTRSALDRHLDFHTAPELRPENADDDDHVVELHVLGCRLTY